MRVLVVSTLLWACVPDAPPPSGERCLEHPRVEGTVVAQVGETALTVRQLVERAEQRGSAAARRLERPKPMRQFVEDQVRMELLVQAALERGLHRDPDVIDAAHKVMVRKLLMQDLGSEAFADSFRPGAVERYYERHRDDYVQPEKRRIADIQLAPTEEGRQLGASLIAQLDGADARQVFRLLAAKHSLDPETKNRGGERFFRAQDEIARDLGEGYAAAVFAPPPGTLLPEPVQSTRGWHVAKVVSVRAPLNRSLDEVRGEIEEKLAKDKRAELFEEYLTGLKRRHPVAIYDERMGEVIEALRGGGR